MKTTWELLIDPELPGSLNMERDRRLLEAVGSSPIARTIVRFYGWDRATLSIGFHQRPEAAADLEFCRRREIPVVRRPTGGRAVLHARELTYSVVSNDQSRFSTGHVLHSYLPISQALQRGLAILGIQARLAPGSPNRSGRARRELQGANPCFASSARYELICRGRKIVGSAQRRLKSSFLQHGSIPLSIEMETMSQALGIGADQLRRHIISVEEAAGRPVPTAELTKALIQGFQDHFEVSFFPNPGAVRDTILGAGEEPQGGN